MNATHFFLSLYNMPPTRNEYMNTMATELHRRIVRNFERRSVLSRGVDDIWGADLVQMPDSLTEINNGYKFILTVVDATSKYAWAEGLKSKAGKEVAAAFRKIFATGRKPNKLWVDQGTEFYNADLQKLLRQKDIHMYSTQSELKVTIVERFNRTLKTLMWKQFTQHETQKWITMLPHLLEEYNNKRHTTIKMTPAEASVKVAEEKAENRQLPEPQLQIGDIVRISKFKATFTKGYLANWSTEQFEVTGYLQRPTDPVVYYLRDLFGEDIIGSFYFEELQKVKFPGKLFVEEIRERRTRKRVKEALVKYIGFDERFNEWIREADVK